MYEIYGLSKAKRSPTLPAHLENELEKRIRDEIESGSHGGLYNLPSSKRPVFKSPWRNVWHTKITINYP